MKIFLFILFISSFHFSLAENAHTPSPQKEKPIATVELIWEVVEGAKGYEIEVQGNDVNKKFQSDTSTFNIQIPIGDYKARGRTKDYRGVFGEWSDFIDFEAIPQTVDLKTSFSQFPPVVKMSKYDGLVRIKWNAIPTAKYYKFYLKDETGKVLSVHETKKPFVTFKTKPGIYKYNVTAIYSGKLESAQSIFEPTLEMNGVKLEVPKIISTPNDEQAGQIKFKVENSKIQLMAKIEYSAYLSEEWETLKDEKIGLTYSTNNIKKPGKYRIGIRSTMLHFTDSDPIYKEFLIKPKDEDLK